jgi:hypothetical protein
VPSVPQVALCDFRRCAALEEQAGVHVSKRMEAGPLDLERIQNWPKPLLDYLLGRVRAAATVDKEQPGRRQLAAEHLAQNLWDRHRTFATLCLGRLNLPVPSRLRYANGPSLEVYVLRSQPRISPARSPVYAAIANINRNGSAAAAMTIAAPSATHYCGL